ncbi:hypothetical protein ACINK0_12010 [Deinococcus sp. VB343]|uniref:hypothetical protein n=1 Tax=Deinococcus sp. VB343 TaxID=3385567 RepID=UPI0039C92D3A
MNFFSRSIAGLTLLTALLGGSVGAVTFGGLNVRPLGAQNLNLQTGVTEMPQGGTVTDQKGGLTLTAARLQVKPDELLQAQGATIKTKFGGTLTAQQVRYDLKAGLVTATGNISYSDARVKNMTATSLTLYVKSGFVVARGNVKASSPALSAAGLVFDPNTMQAVLSGPYDLITRLGGMKGQAGGRVLLTFAGNALTGASARPAPGDLARFSPYLK